MILNLKGRIPDAGDSVKNKFKEISFKKEYRGMKTQDKFIAHPQTSEQVSALKVFMHALTN